MEQDQRFVTAMSAFNCGKTHQAAKLAIDHGRQDGYILFRLIETIGIEIGPAVAASFALLIFQRLIPHLPETENDQIPES